MSRRTAKNEEVKQFVESEYTRLKIRFLERVNDRPHGVPSPSPEHVEKHHGWHVLIQRNEVHNSYPAHEHVQDGVDPTGRLGKEELEEKPGVQGVSPSPKRLEAFLDQILLRIWAASPGLASYIESFRVVPEKGSIELSFYKVPEEVISGIEQVFGLPNIESLRYTKGGSACIGFRVTPSKEDLSALAVDDADDHAGIKSEEDEANKLEGAGLTSVGAEANNLLKAPGKSAQF